MKKVFLIALLATGLAACNHTATDTAAVSANDSTAVVAADTTATAVADTAKVDTAK